jgi:cytochrome P450
MQKAREDIVTRFILASEEDPETMNDRYLRDIVLNFLIAGKDTTANTLTWFFYMLCKNPVVQDKVALEINESLEWAKEDNSIENFTARLNEGAIENMHYLHAAITETLRLYPAVAVVCIASKDIPVHKRPN